LIWARRNIDRIPLLLATFESLLEQHDSYIKPSFQLAFELFNGNSNFLLTLLLIIDPQNHHDKRSTTIATGRYRANEVANGRG
jgi:hypothetical protein